MALGERIAVLRRSKAGVDEMGDPVYEWTSETVEGALVRPVQPSEVDDSKRPDGWTASWSIALPKEYTASCAPLAHSRVALVGRGMPEDPDVALRTVGSPSRTIPCPTRWDVILEAVEIHG